MIVYVEAAGCTNACRHCGSNGRPPYGTIYSIDELRKLVETWGPITPFYEFTAHPDFPEIMNPQIVGYEGEVLPTNGFGLARTEDYRAIFDRLREFGYNMISCTLHGLEENHDWFVARKGAYQDILKASAKAVEAGFYVHWNIFLDNRNLEDVLALVELSRRNEFDSSPWIGIPSHRVSRRMWQYEQLRPSLRDVQERLPHELIAKTWKRPLEEFTEANWLHAWEKEPDSEDFKHPSEPKTWPPNPSFENLTIFITRNRKVYFDPRCAPRIFLDELDVGKDGILKKLQELPTPHGYLIKPPKVNLIDDDAELLHPNGHSVRCKTISAALFQDS